MASACGHWLDLIAYSREYELRKYQCGAHAVFLPGMKNDIESSKGVVVALLSSRLNVVCLSIETHGVYTEWVSSSLELFGGYTKYPTKEKPIQMITYYYSNYALNIMSTWHERWHEIS